MHTAAAEACLLLWGLSAVAGREWQCSAHQLRFVARLFVCLSVCCCTAGRHNRTHPFTHIARMKGQGSLHSAMVPALLQSWGLWAYPSPYLIPTAFHALQHAGVLCDTSAVVVEVVRVHLTDDLAAQNNYFIGQRFVSTSMSAVIRLLCSRCHQFSACGSQWCVCVFAGVSSRCLHMSMMRIVYPPSALDLTPLWGSVCVLASMHPEHASKYVRGAATLLQ